MVFQHPVLSPHLSVFENLAFSLRARKVGQAELEGRVAAVAEDLGLLDVLGRPSTALSGGQRQRVALGRAIVRRPRMFLFDEPLSGLDPPLRSSARADMMGLHRRYQTTTLHVTHDQNEALSVAGSSRWGRLGKSTTSRVTDSWPSSWGAPP
jgi:multiple sugar transport system ATP-binding protein